MRFLLFISLSPLCVLQVFVSFNTMAMFPFIQFDFFQVNNMEKDEKSSPSRNQLISSQLEANHKVQQHQLHENDERLNLSLTLQGGLNKIDRLLNFPERKDMSLPMVSVRHHGEFTVPGGEKKRKRTTSGYEPGITLFGKRITPESGNNINKKEKMKKKRKDELGVRLFGVYLCPSSANNINEKKKKTPKQKLPPLVIQPTIDPDNPVGVTVPYSDDDKYTIKKQLQSSDIKQQQNRLLIPVEDVMGRIKNFLNPEQNWYVEESSGINVIIKDLDNTPPLLHQLNFVRWSSGSYVFQSNWMTNFVKRKYLKEGDEIKMHWIPEESQFALWTS